MRLIVARCAFAAPVSPRFVVEWGAARMGPLVRAQINDDIGKPCSVLDRCCDLSDEGAGSASANAI